MSTFEELTDDEVAEQVDEINEWLVSLGVTMWADWNIQQPERREGAATWFLKQIHDYMDYYDDQTAKATAVLKYGRRLVGA